MRFSLFVMNLEQRAQQRLNWLAVLSTKELAIYLIELGRLREQQPELAGEVDDACAMMREELRRREWITETVR